MSFLPVTSKQPLVINIGGANAENHAEAENRSTNINILQNGIGQTIEIEQNASAVVNNITAIIIGSPYPISFALNEDNKNIEIEISEDGEVKLNGDKMEIKELVNGIKVMFLHSEKEKSKVNNQEVNNADVEIEIK
jgi:hypothetical protein